MMRDDYTTPVRRMIEGSTTSRDEARNVLLALLQTGAALTGPVGAAGGSVGRLAIEHWWGPAISRRLTTWVEILVERLLDLEDDVEKLKESIVADDVAAVGVIAANAATRAADDSKLERIAQALANITADRANWTGQTDHAQALMRLVDDLTSTQLSVLEFLYSPLEWQARYGEYGEIKISENGRVRIYDAIGAAFPDLPKNPEIIATVLQTLEARGLMNAESISYDHSSFASMEAVLAGSASIVGGEVVRYIQRPIN